MHFERTRRAAGDSQPHTAANNSFWSGRESLPTLCPSDATVLVEKDSSETGLTKPTRFDLGVGRPTGEVVDSDRVSAWTDVPLLPPVEDPSLLAEKEQTRPAGSHGNITLNRAFSARKDEFYTQYPDVAKEMAFYPDQFQGKSVLCNCDDPFESAFFRYFLLNFEALGLAKLTSIRYSGAPLLGGRSPLGEASRGFKTVVTQLPDGPLTAPDGSLNLDKVLRLPGNALTELAGDGDFRSDECIKILDEADVVVTNPPFSLFREFLGQLVDHSKNFIILGNMNASTGKQIFPLFRDRKVWYGESIRSGDRKFNVPDDYPLDAAGCGVDDDGKRFIRVKGVRWFTNLKTGGRRPRLELPNKYRAELYPKFQNYNAIEVGRTSRIPSDYLGVMGVPITYLDKHDPEEFDMLMLANGNARTSVNPSVLDEVGYKRHPDDKGGVGIVNGKRAYARILIRRKAA